MQNWINFIAREAKYILPVFKLRKPFFYLLLWMAIASVQYILDILEGTDIRNNDYRNIKKKIYLIKDK